MIVDSNLKALIKKHKIITESRFDTSCVNLTLDKTIKRYIVPEDRIITYESDLIEDYVEEIELNNEDGYVLNPQECILACSQENVKMPNFCFGLLQTKGSLARLFVFTNCADGQVDPGYHGKITFELYNASNFKVKLTPGQAVGNLYIFRTSTNAEGYHGRYQNANSPTFSKSKTK